MPSHARRSAQAWARTLDAQYADASGMPTDPAADDRFTMCPRRPVAGSASSSSGRNAFVTATVPKKFTSITRRYVDMGVKSTMWPTAIPATLARPASRAGAGAWDLYSSTAAATDASSVTSSTNATMRAAPPPLPATVAAAAASSSAPFCVRQPANTT